MRLKMYTPNGHEIIDSSEVAQFYPDAASGNQLTKIETSPPRERESRCW